MDLFQNIMTYGQAWMSENWFLKILFFTMLFVFITIVEIPIIYYGYRLLPKSTQHFIFKYYSLYGNIWKDHLLLSIYFELVFALAIGLVLNIAISLLTIGYLKDLYPDYLGYTYLIYVASLFFETWRRYHTERKKALDKQTS